MAAKEKTQANQVKEPVIYCGPNISSVGLLNSTVFINGSPEYLKSIIEKCPAISGLIVPVKEISRVNAEIKRKGSYENTLYNQVVKYISEVRSNV